MFSPCSAKEELLTKIYLYSFELAQVIYYVKMGGNDDKLLIKKRDPLKRWYSFLEEGKPTLIFVMGDAYHTNTKMQENLQEFFSNHPLVHQEFVIVKQAIIQYLCENWGGSEVTFFWVVVVFLTQVSIKFKWNPRVYQLARHSISKSVIQTKLANHWVMTLVRVDQQTVVYDH